MMKIITGKKNPILRKKGEEIEKITTGIRNLAEQMFGTMKEADGIGLAAPQVGRSIQLFVVDELAFDKERSKWEFKNLAFGENLSLNEVQSKNLAFGENLSLNEVQSKNLAFCENLSLNEVQSKNLAFGENLSLNEVQSKNLAFGENLSLNEVQSKNLAFGENLS
ncbi:MAG: peptide deformylase, partial [Candidatus Portnoybacteria bacterium]|nr:peptide deformylase [Candidatus Portnoybacteria bacterium]